MASDGWVKVVGDWIDRDLGVDGDLRPLWTREQLTAGTAAAHREGARVTVHTFATESIDDLLAAGVDDIQHGTGLLPEHFATLVERGIAVTPTLLQVGEFERIASQADGKYPLFAARMRAMYARRYEHVRAMHDAGVKLLIGTDAGGTIAHGSVAKEAAELVKAGVPATDVVGALAWWGRRYAGFADPVENASADLVVYPADPRQDIGVLAAPLAVILRGRLVRPVGS